MHIVHTESSLGWGGQEIRILSEAQALAMLGCQVTIVCDETSLLNERGTNYQVRIYPIQLRKKAIPDLLALRKTLHILRPDVLSCHSSIDHWLTAVCRLVFRMQFPIVRTRHISAKINGNFLTRWLYGAGCNAIMTTGESIRQGILQAGLAPEEKVLSVPTGIDLNYFKPMNRQAAKRALGFSGEDLIFGNIATLRSWKGQHDLLEAFRTINHPHVRLLIVGDGPQASSLHERSRTLGIADRVTFAGHQADVRPYLDAIDVFVFPSYANEGIPQAILQAIAYGLPIITTTAGSIQEAVSSYPRVRFVTARNVDQLSAEMRKFIDTNELKRSLEAATDGAVMSRISIESMAQLALKVYSGVARKKLP